MEPDDLLCSRNARPGKALVGRAQWKITQPPSLKEITSKLGEMERSGQVPSSLAERAQSECARPMRAVDGKLGHTPIKICEERREESPGDSLCSRSARPQKALVGRAHDVNPPDNSSDTRGDEENNVC